MKCDGWPSCQGLCDDEWLCPAAAARELTAGAVVGALPVLLCQPAGEPLRTSALRVATNTRMIANTIGMVVKVSRLLQCAVTAEIGLGLYA